MNSTIVACCTGNLSAALSLIRISGPKALQVASFIAQLQSGKKLQDYKSHSIAYGSIICNGEKIDQVLFLIMHGPHTFTGEDTVEITCHGNPFIVEKIIKSAIASGAQFAAPGEFSKQAVLNNKLDVIQAEAINELINANTNQGLKQALAQLNGTLSQYIARIEQKLISVLALTQASFEFIEEESITFDEQIKEKIFQIQHDIAQLKKSFDQQKQIRDGIKIALIGSVNAGKSSLFNTLIAQDRAIVTDIAGTTRDVIEAGIYRNDYYLTLIDTAGLRKTDNQIEKIGIEKSFAQAAIADIILLVFDGSKKLSDQEMVVYKELYEKYKEKIIIVITKSDLPKLFDEDIYKNSIYVSSQSKDGIANLESTITKKIDTLLTTTSPFLLNQRQYTLLLSLEKQLEKIQEMIKTSFEYELIAAELIEAIANSAELTGKTVSEQSMDAVFRQFCVGK